MSQMIKPTPTPEHIICFIDSVCKLKVDTDTEHLISEVYYHLNELKIKLQGHRYGSLFIFFLGHLVSDFANGIENCSIAPLSQSLLNTFQTSLAGIKNVYLNKHNIPTNNPVSSLHYKRLARNKESLDFAIRAFQNIDSPNAMYIAAIIGLHLMDSGPDAAEFTELKIALLEYRHDKSAFHSCDKNFKLCLKKLIELRSQQQNQ
jgi:hypothetical protein